MKKFGAFLTVFVLIIQCLMVNTVIVSAAGDLPNLNHAGYKSGTNPFSTSGYGGQCTAFVWGRAYEKLGISLPFRNDAKVWWTSNEAQHYYSYGSTPKGNSIAVWSDSTYGHVAFVEKVVGDTVYFNEANWNTYNGSNWGGGYDGYLKSLSSAGMRTRGRYSLLGYIYLENEPPKPESSFGVDYDSLHEGIAMSQIKDITGWIKNGGKYPYFKIYVDYGEVGIAYPNSAEDGIFRYSFDTTKYSDGEHLIGVKVLNEEGLDYTSWYHVIIDNTAPVLSNVSVTNVNELGYDVSLTVNDSGSGISFVRYPTWTEKNGQDDITFDIASTNGNSVHFRVNTADHRSQYGQYNTHIYAYDNAGNPGIYCMSVTIHPFKPSRVEITKDQNSIYSLFTDQYNWDTASDHCKKMNGRLATVFNQQQNKLISEMVVSMGGKNSYYLGGSRSGDRWLWNTGTLFSYQNWAEGEPNNSGGSEDKLCVAFNGKWNDLGGNSKDTGYIMQTSIEKDESVSSEWNGHKYVLYDKPMPWEVAKAYCEALGGHLVTIESQQENSELAKLAQRGTLSSYMIGISRDDKTNSWKSVSGDTISYANWANSEPNNLDGIESYGYFDKKSTQWNDNRSFPGDAGFICEFDTTIGDVNGDSVVNVLDIQMIQRHISGIKTLTADQKGAADVNGDGIINIFDVQRIQRSILGIQKLN